MASCVHPLSNVLQLVPTRLAAVHPYLRVISNRGWTHWYRTEANRVAFELAAIEFGALKDKPSKLANAGLLLATLFQGEAEIVQISMLTQIDKASGGKTIWRTLQSA